MEGNMWFGEILKKDREKQREEKLQRIRESRFCRWYGAVRTEGIPEYLRKGWGENRWKRVIRFRLGNEMRESEY